VVSLMIWSKFRSISLMTMFCSSSPMSISERDRELRRVVASSSELVFKISLAQCSRISSAVSSKK
jgi:hypothetical protein